MIFQGDRSVAALRQMVMQFTFSTIVLIPIAFLEWLAYQHLTLQLYGFGMIVFTFLPEKNSASGPYTIYLGQVEVIEKRLIVSSQLNVSGLTLHWDDIVDVKYKKSWPYFLPLWSVGLICDRRNIKEMHKLLPNNQMEVSFPWPLADEQDFKRCVLEVAPERHPLRDFVSRVIS